MREQDEKTNVRHFRTAHRYFFQDGQWWFSTREGEEGPYNSREHAEVALTRYMNSIQMMSKFQAEQKAKIEKEPKFGGDPTVWDRQIDSL